MGNETLGGSWQTGGLHNTSIGARPCITDVDMKYTLSDSFSSIIVLLFMIAEAAVLLMCVLPFTTAYLVYRMGFVKTIKLFKRVDREHKRKKITFF